MICLLLLIVGMVAFIPELIILALALAFALMILFPALVIMLVAVLLIVIADELLTKEIKEIKHIINGRSSKIRNKQRQGAAHLQSLRSELITLAEKGEIKQSVAYIKKKANYITLEKIKVEYERKQLQETNEYLPNHLWKNYQNSWKELT